MAIYSIKIEQYVLCGVIKNPVIYADIAPFVQETDFYDDIHKTIFLVIKSLASKNERWDKVILAEKIKNLGVAFKDDINIYDYIDNLSYMSITQQAAIDASRELVKLRVRRDLESTAEEMKTFVKTNGNLTLDELVGGIDSIYGQKTSIYTVDDQPRNLYDGIEEMVEERGNNPLEEVGLATPYPEFNRMYGGLRPKNIYAVCSRGGVGKTSLMCDMSLKMAQANKVKVFYADTEMSTEEIQWRIAAARSGISQWYIETGNWRKNAEMIKKVRTSFDDIRKNKEAEYFTHYHVGDKSLDQIFSVVRRWKSKNVKADELFIFVYDYIQLAEGDNSNKNFQEYQVLGEKIKRLKRFSEEMNCPLLTAIQSNRSGEGLNKKSSDLTDNSSAIGDTDRLQRTATFVGIFRRKTLDEIAQDGIEFGTHKLIPLKTRFQGRDAAGHHDLVKRLDENGDTKWVNNYLNFSVNNFDVVELGSLKTIIEKQKNTQAPIAPNTNDGETL